MAPNDAAYAGDPYAGSCCLYTVAGMAVGYGPNGSVLIYDVQGGTMDAYTADKNGLICEVDTRGNCTQNGPYPHP